MTESNNQIWHVNERNGLWVSSPISRRQLFAGAGGVALLGDAGGLRWGSRQSAGSGSGSSAGTPKQGGDFRLGVTGGGAKDMFDGQNIVTKPDQARLVSAFETLLTFDDEYQLQTDGLAESVEADNPTGSYTIRLRKRHRVPGRQDPDGRRRHLLVAADRHREIRSDRFCRDCARWTSRT